LVPLTYEPMFARINAQETIFGELDRVKLLSMAVAWPTCAISVRVHRNLAAEHIIAATRPFALYGGYEIVPSFSDYDDGLSFVTVAPGEDPDVELVLLDYARYGLSGEALGDYIVGRIRALRSVSRAPIVVVDLPPGDERGSEVGRRLAGAAKELPSVLVAAHSDALSGEAGPVLTARAAAMTGVPYTPKALLSLGRQLGLSWLPAALGRRVRAVAFDLDGTLYDGVLGEDGVDGLRMGEHHRALHQQVARLHDQGVFVAIVSKNDAKDVDHLFASGAMGMTKSDVDAWAVSWGQKDEAVTEIAAQLRIAPDSFVFVDDNPGELLRVSLAHAGLAVLHAADPAITSRALARFPGLFRFADAGADKLRVADMAAETERDALRRSSADPDSYLRSLEVRLTYGVNRAEDRARLAELSAKTNQFCTSLKRLNEGDIAQRLEDRGACVLSIGMEDRLSDSGIVAFMSARCEGDVAIVEDICVSCRALGRGVENYMLQEGLKKVAEELEVGSLHVPWTDGPRNGPALAWLAELCGQVLTDNPLSIPVPSPRPTPVTVSWAGQARMSEIVIGRA
jgi:FkbH-like protein